jgi:hypothetical protein
MTPERWQQIERVFHEALTRDVAGRAAFLADACAGDEPLRQDVESLLAQEAPAGSFLSGPALDAPVRRWRRPEARPLADLSDFHPAVLSDFQPALTASFCNHCLAGGGSGWACLDPRGHNRGRRREPLP